MTIVKTLIVLLFLALAPQAFAAESHGIDALLNEAISQHLISGGVVLVGNRERVLFRRAYGRVSTQADAKATTPETIFDLASLTKVVATAPAILKLAEEGRLSLLDPLQKWFPELASRGKDQILLLNLLTHTSGLEDFPLSGTDPLASAISGVAGQKIKGVVGNRFKYADINFILLAEIVRRATGAPLDVYAQASFYRPLGMTDTSFNTRQKERCAATIVEDRLFTGEPQDQLCRLLGGVAGHAGLFSTVDDLARFSRMMLAGGVLNGVRVLEARSVLQMTAPYFSRGGEVVRGLGWDIASPYSSPRGDGFSSFSFGHTGYSGTSVWVDPLSGTFVLLLTTRLDYARVKEFNRLRSELSTRANALFGMSREMREMSQLP